jgi:hypothetical protein
MPRQNDLNETLVKSGVERALAPEAFVWMNRAFWLSWVLLLFNLLPVYPLDGGQILQGLLWSRIGYQRGTRIAAYVGLGCGVLFLIAAIAVNESLLMGLGLFLLFSCFTKLRELESENFMYGSEFASSFADEEDEEKSAPPRKQGFLQRWRAKRAERRLLQEQEQRQQDAARLDQILEKIAVSGRASLTEEERRFMDRVSAKLRKKP